VTDAITNVGPAAVGAVVFVLLAAWCFSHRRVDQSLVALGLYLGLLDGYLKLRTGSPVITLARDVLVVAIAGGALLRAVQSNKPLPLPPIGVLVLAFSAVVLVELFNPDGPGLTVGAGGVRQHLEFVPLFFLGYAFMRRETQIQKLMFILVLCAAVGGFVSYVQSTLTPEQFANWGPGYRERILGTGTFAGAGRVAFDDSGVASVRPFGLGSDLGGGAVAAALALPSLIAMLMVAKPQARIWLMPFIVGIALAIATSGTRAALITAFVSAVSFAMLAAASRKALQVIAAIAVGVVVVYAAFEYLGPRNSTTQRAKSITPGRVVTTFSEERGSSVAKFAEYASKYPLGLGVGTVGPAAAALNDRPIASQAVLNIETEWNFLVLEVGLVGVALFLAINFRLVLALTRIRRIADHTMRLRLAALAAPLFGLLAADFAGTTTASVPPAPYFWFVGGVLSYWLVTAYQDEGRLNTTEEDQAASPGRAQAPPAGTRRPLSGVMPCA